MTENELFEADGLILTNNLCDVAKTDGASDAVGRYSMDELARYLAYGCDDEYVFLKNYRSIRATLPRHKASLTAYFCKRLCFFLSEKGRLPALSDFFHSEPIEKENVIYVKTAISDAAFRIFGKFLKNASVSYAPSFASACEEVCYGRTSYCILPYENSDEGTLSGFMRLINKYELYPHCVCSYQTENGVTRLALLSRTPCVKDALGLDMCVKATFHTLDGEVLSDVMTAARELSLTLAKIDSFPALRDDGGYGGSVTFSAKPENVIPFLAYLELEVPECADKAVYYAVKSH